MNKTINKLTTKRIVKILITGIFLSAVAVGLQWATFSRQPLPNAIEALESDEFVIVDYDPWLSFSPSVNDKNTGVIF